MPQDSRSKPDRRANRLILGRTICLMILFGIVTFIPLFVKLFHIQITNHERFQKLAIEQQTKDMTVSAARGEIFDRKGNILAISATVHNVIVSPRDILQNKLDPDFIADGLSKILDLDPSGIKTKLEKKTSAYEIIKRKIEEEQATAVRTFIAEHKLAGGVYLTPDTKRYYPYSSLAAQVIGFVGTDNYGLYGMEALYEEYLKGSNGRVVTAKNGAGTEMLYRYENYFDAVDGCDLTLSIDATIQYLCERVLQEGIKNFEVQKGGFAIAMEPKTGAILAFANSPDYDLNRPSSIADPDVAATLELLQGDEYKKALGEAQLAQWRNKALNDTYEPGSTFKAMVLAAALEEGVVSESDSFYCSGSVNIAGWNIRCHKRSGHGSQTLAQAVENSCNPAFMAIGQRLGAERFYQYLSDFGFLGLTGIDMQGEAGSIVWDKKYFTSEEGLASLASASFGQTLKVTPLQLITAGAAVVNGGHLMQPYVLQSITDASKNIVEYRNPIEVRQVISQAVSEKVRAILEGVVSTGTGKNAYVPGYRIGGKTGTSQKRDEKSGDVIVSFLGFAPADDPQVIILLAYDSPKPTSPGGNYTKAGYYISGGNMAAPMAGQLLTDILDYLGVEKQYTPSEIGGIDTLTPHVVGMSLADAQVKLEEKGLSFRAVGTGEVVTAQIPAAGAPIPGGSQAILYLGDARPSETVKVPSVIGCNPEQARQKLSESGLYMREIGAANNQATATIATGQSIEYGFEVQAGAIIEVRFADNHISD